MANFNRKLMKRKLKMYPNFLGHGKIWILTFIITIKRFELAKFLENIFIKEDVSDEIIL